ncbi:MAG: hypothetical protein JO092_00890 [Candidatus Eremiobacteraeota bacterium]|nr:hypothetical protein [Candidatus Eremiobacteraeota bacterium]
MHTFIRALTLSAVMAVGLSAVASAAQVDYFKPAPGSQYALVALADGGTIYCRKAGGEQNKYQLFKLVGGKYVPLAPGSYKQKNGNVIMVVQGGYVSPGSQVMFNPQPEPPIH